jgi:hypothetical protein
MKNEHEKFVQMGIATLMPGMQYMIERMQATLDEMRGQLARLQGAEEAEPVTSKRRVDAGKQGWAGMSAEERSAEMRRRYKVRAKKARASAAKSRWDEMSKKEREEWKHKMQAGRKKAERTARQVVDAAKQSRLAVA